MASDRQMPKTQEYFQNPLYWDVIYGYIQANSEWDGVEGHPRVLPKSKAVFSKIAAQFKMSRQTVSNKFADLENGRKGKQGLGLIKKLDNGDYELRILDNEIATLIDSKTLRMLTSFCNDNVINIYIYLFGRWKASGEKDFVFTYEQLKRVIGIGDKSTSNNYIIKDILNGLISMGLLELDVNTVLSNMGGYKTTFTVVKMQDKIIDTIEELQRKKC